MDNEFKGFFWKGDIDNYFPGHQFEEIFKSRIYAPYLEDKKDPIVIDIGANIGIFTLYASKYAKKVYSVEPSQEHFDCLIHMIEFNKLENVTPLKFAIANSEGKMTFNHPVNKTMYSLLHTGVSEVGSEEVDVITIETLFKQNSIEHVDLLKMDTEGSEFEILGGEAFKKVSLLIDVIVLESHSWANRNPNQIRDSLKIAGFSKVDIIPGEATLWVGRK